MIDIHSTKQSTVFFLDDNSLEMNTTLDKEFYSNNTLTESGEENKNLSSSNVNSSQEFEMLTNNEEDSIKHSQEIDTSNNLIVKEGILINNPSFENTELFEIQSIGDEELFQTEECYVDQIEEKSEKSIRLMDLLESKESCV